MSDPLLSEILSPKSPTVANAVFGSAPRPRRPSTPKTPPTSTGSGSLSFGSGSQPRTPVSAYKDLPPIPVPGSADPKVQSAAKVRNSNPNSAATSASPRPERRPDSPDVEQMIKQTPRPRRKSSATFAHSHSPGIAARSRSSSTMAMPSSWKGLKNKDSFSTEETESVISDYGALIEKEEVDESGEERQGEGDGSESDSSIDIHTPLPHLMFRDGLLSPRSKLLPGGGSATLSLYLDGGDDLSSGKRAQSVLSVASTVGSTMTKSGIYRDPRDTARRRIRHRDQTLLRAGMGLTTGLGWSDSEDEDAPSLLTRRLITSNINRQPSVRTSISRAPSQLAKSTSAGSLSHTYSHTSPPVSYSPVPLSHSKSASFSQNRLNAADTDSVTSVDASSASAARRPPMRTRTQSNASASSVVSSGSRDSSTAAHSIASSQQSHLRTGVPRPLRLPQTAGIGIGMGSSITRSTSAVDSHPPVAIANARTAQGLLSRSASATTSASVSAMQRPRTRTLSNPSARPGHSSVPPTSLRSVGAAAAAASRIVPPRSVSTSIMAPVRSMSMSMSTSNSISSLERGNNAANNGGDTLVDFPLPPASAGASSSSSSSSFSSGFPALAMGMRPNVNAHTHIKRPSTTASSLSASPVLGTSTGTGSGTRVLNTVGTGPRPKPRTGTGMMYRNSSYSSFYETSRISRASSVTSSGKEVGVI